VFRNKTSNAEMEETQAFERPNKRLKLDSEEQERVLQSKDFPINDTQIASSSVQKSDQRADSLDTKATMEAQSLKESEVGIVGYVSSSLEGFTGILKKRYTDFLVNEILPNGEVCHLKNTKAPRGTQREVRENHQDDSIEIVKSEAEPDHPAEKNEDKSVIVNSGTTNGVELRGTADSENGISTGLDKAKAPDEESPKKSTEERESSKIEEISSDDRALLVSYLNETAVTELLKLYTKILANPNIKPKEHGTVRTDFTSDRSVRGQIHQAIRRIFSSRIDSSTDSEGILVLSAALPSYRQPRNQPGRGGYGHTTGRERGGRPTWAERGGNFLHFTLFKENKDTMEVVSFLAKQLKTKPRDFQFAGTKDRRAVTVQRVSAYRLDAERVANLNRMIRGSQMGDFSYQPQGLELGDLKGNEFVITLRECSFPSIGINHSMAPWLASAKSLISDAMSSLHTNGFTNYYGLQRFGTFSTSTDTIGLALLQSNFPLATSLILSYNPNALTAALDPTSGSTHSTNTSAIGQDDKSRALAISLFESKEQDIQKILANLPYKFSAESNVIRHLHRHPTDHAGAIALIPRNLKLMYVHAYQSMVWNFAATKRQEVYGDKVAEGDLVLVHEHPNTSTAEAQMKETVDADGEIVLQPAQDDRSNNADAMFERARPLSAAEAASGRYSIFDIVLPQPGFDVLYPSNEIGKFYESFMGSEAGGGLDPHDMRRKVKDFSLSGSYRKVRARVEGGEVEVRGYSGEMRQFVLTDLERLRKKQNVVDGINGLVVEDESEEGEGDKIAVVLKFQLGSSQYATMALRELMKGGVVVHKPDFGGRG
jgi:tRNA pseudouridine13 synthase